MNEVTKATNAWNEARRLAGDAMREALQVPPGTGHEPEFQKAYEKSQALFARATELRRVVRSLRS